MKSFDKDIHGSNISELLEQVGLTDTEARMYLAGHDSGSITAQELVKKTGIKRPTAYHALHTLAEKGLVSEGKGSFRMEAPGKLLGWIEQQKESLVRKEDLVQALMAQLATHSPGGASSVSVVEYTDAKSVQAVIDLGFYARSKQFVLALPSKEFLHELDARVQEAAARGVKVRAVIKKVDSALLIYDGKTVIIEHPSKAVVIDSAPLAQALSALL